MSTKKSSKSKERKPEKVTKEKKKSKKISKPKTPSPEPEIYEDDFEDYEDDFEEIEDENEEIQQEPTESPRKIENSSDVFNQTNGKNEEDESNIVRRLSRAHFNQASNLKPSSISNPPIPSQVSSFPIIDNKPYIAYNEEERRSLEKRGNERLQKLRGLISIETSKCSVITDLSSNIFEPFQALPSNLSHAFCQTSNDSKSEEIQTEIGEFDTKETQFPHVESGFNPFIQKETTPASRMRFKKFIFSAAQTIREVLISDDYKFEGEETREKTVMKFSRGFNSFQLGAVAQKSKATYVTFGEADSVLVAFEIFETPAQDLVNKSLIVEFYIHRRRPPKRLFVVESVVSSMILSVESQILYVSLKDGTFCAFDLSTADTNSDDFLPWVDSENDIALRRPTFDSSFLVTTISDASPLIGLAVSTAPNGEDITTVDTSGTISYWLASRIEKNELSIQLTAVIRPHPVIKRQSNSFAISSFGFVKSPPRIFIGTDIGSLFSMYKSDSSQSIPKVYKTENEKYGEITSIAVNPFDNYFLIIGFSNGGLALYRTNQTSSIINFPKSDLSSRVTCVMWSYSNSFAFYSIQGGKSIIFWDISHQLTPISTDTRHEPGIMLSAKIWKNKGSMMNYMGITLDTGETEVHVLETPQPKHPNEKLAEVLNRIRIH